MATSDSIPVETLRQLLVYDPNTGALTWKHRPRSMFATDRAFGMWNTRFAGKPAFNDKGRRYCRGHIFRKGLFAHRVIWAIVNGEWPRNQIDHINGEPDDNRITNLRAVDTTTNMRNQKRRRTNLSGMTGVGIFRATGKWRARIKVGGDDIHLGFFMTFAEACAARKSAEKEHGFHCNHGR